LAYPVVSDDGVTTFDVVWERAYSDTDGDVFGVTFLLTDRVAFVVSFVWQARAGGLWVEAIVTPDD